MYVDVDVDDDVMRLGAVLCFLFAVIPSILSPFLVHQFWQALCSLLPPFASLDAVP
jgi:hypothetical protein